MPLWVPFRCTGLMYHIYQLDNTLHNKQIHTEDEIRHLCQKLYRFLADFCLNSSINRWGSQYEDFYKKRAKGAKVDKRKALVEQLTTTFTREQLKELIRQNEMDTDARFFLSQWKAMGWIERVSTNVFRKPI